MRKSKPKKRIILPDPKFNDVQVTRFVNNMMYDGKKSIAYSIFYDAVEIAEKKAGENGLEIFKRALTNIMPAVEVKSRRVGGANYQIPFEVKGQRQNHLTTMWFVAACRSRKGMSMADRIAAELMDAYNNQGAAVKKREETHRMADANRAFAHFARG